MPTKQGDPALLNDPIAQELLHSTIPARFAYVWHDGTPRVIPMWFHWNGEEVVLGYPTEGAKDEGIGAKLKSGTDNRHQYLAE